MIIRFTSARAARVTSTIRVIRVIRIIKLIRVISGIRVIRFIRLIRFIRFTRAIMIIIIIRVATASSVYKAANVAFVVRVKVCERVKGRATVSPTTRANCINVNYIIPLLRAVQSDHSCRRVDPLAASYEQSKSSASSSGSFE